MKYSWEFKLECVTNYKIGKINTKPEYTKCSQKEFIVKLKEQTKPPLTNAILSKNQYKKIMDYEI